jgi:hypothetical protein
METVTDPISTWTTSIPWPEDTYVLVLTLVLPRWFSRWLLRVTPRRWQPWRYEERFYRIVPPSPDTTTRGTITQGGPSIGR